MLRGKIKGVAEVLDLLKADHACVLAFALAAAAHGEAHRDVAKIVEHTGGCQYVRRILVAAEAMQHQEGRALLTRFYAVRNADRAVELQARRGDAESFFRHVCQSFFDLSRPSSRQRALAASTSFCSGHTVGGKRAPPRSGSGS